MHHEVVCPGGHRVRVTEEHFGQQVKCPTCGQTFKVPDVPMIEPDASQLPKVDAGGAVSRLRERWKTHAPKMSGLALPAGRPMLAVGLLLVLISRGCDTVGQRGVTRARAKASIEQAQFDDQWDQKKLEFQQQLDDLDPGDAERRSSIQEKRRLEEDKHKQQRRDLEVGRWRDLQIAGRPAGTRCL